MFYVATHIQEHYAEKWEEGNSTEDLGNSLHGIINKHNIYGHKKLGFCKHALCLTGLSVLFDFMFLHNKRLQLT